MCEEGERANLMEDRDIFTIDSPRGVNPDDVLPGSLAALDENEMLIIEIPNRVFFLASLKYFSTVRTQVTIFFNDNNQDPVAAEVRV